jgi:GTP-binding protein EngB required for normal cell division
MKFPFLWRKAASRPVFDGAASPVPQSGAASRILRDVLSDGPAPEPQVKARGSESDPVPLSNRLSVGARLDDARARVLNAARTLSTLADKETAQAISAVAGQLQRQACRVAFVGQVKAGKSSLINVLVEQPDLLPANINPCTAVVTRLSFGVPDKPQSGALFTFFNREEWRRLSLGGRTRELTDRLFPDFNWEVLRTQVKAMENRAREKLGASFEELLGKEHLYEEVQPDLLVRYVGAEHPDAESLAERAEGKFSDITKSADIYLDLGAFSFPTVLIDTPGVNDPFLVRDEITRQNLEAADICVVVVTARQPLSATDINLLRMLRGLKKNRLIIFINKVDELRGGEEVLQEIGRQVSSTLKREFPSAHIPVVFGSAAYAHKALNRGIEPTLAGAADAQDEAAAGFQWLSQAGIADKAKAEAFFLKSGLLSLAVSISEMMSAGPIADSVGAATRLIDAVGRNLIAWLGIEAAMLRRIPLEAGEAQKELDVLASLRHELAAKFDAYPERLDAIHAQEVSLIKQRLSSAVQAFIPEALAALADGDIARQASQTDVKLRMRLEAVFQDAIEDTGEMLAAEHEALRSELTRLVEAAGLPGNPMIILGPPLTLTPSLAALSEPAALGFTTHLTQLNENGGGDGPGVNLQDLIVADFAPIIETLASEASRVFEEGTATFARQAKALTFGPIDSVIEKVSLALQEAQTPPQEDVEASIRAIRESISNLKPVHEARQGAAAQAAGSQF